MRKHLLILSSFFTLMTCQSSSDNPAVEHFGVLREIMMEQKLEANIDLEDLKYSENLYGLGALKDLSGELIILGGEVYQSTVNDSGNVEVVEKREGGATLLVTSEVDDWIAISIQEEIESLSQLQEVVSREAGNHFLDTEKPFPFMIEGELLVDWHVINAPAALERTHESFKQSGVSGTFFHEPATVLGFFSDKHEGVYTHHGSYLHAHVFKKEDYLLMGHVDEFVSRLPFVLKLPKVVKQ